MVTLEDVKKAYDDLSEEDKKAFHLSLKDSEDECAGEEEHAEGAEDSQEATEHETETISADNTDGDEVEESEEIEDVSESDESKEVQADAEAKTEGSKEPTIGEVMELITKLTAEVAALRHANETNKPVEEVGVDGEYVDELAPAMPTSYLEQAKKMRF